MARSAAFSQGAQSLAAIAIASLGGPVPAVGAALSELVKFGRVRFDSSANERDLWGAVVLQVEAVAESERIGTESVQVGLDTATAAVAKHGPTLAELIEMNFDAAAAARVVIADARGEDRYWGSERHYAVAERAIGAVYAGLKRQHTDREPTLVACIGWLHGRLDILVSGQQAATETLSELVAALTAVGTVEDLRIYLGAQIERWNEPIWHPRGRRVADLEQRLRMTATTTADPRRGERLSADDALAGAGMLVVLGGPGSGKTWLARRYARQSAEQALAALEAGTKLEQVELPLFTTWDHWAKNETDGLRERLVQAATSRGVDDLGGEPVTARLRRAFTRPGARVLVVVDSLDEAADNPARGGQWTNLRDLSSLPAGGWKVVVTSRLGAWTASSRGFGEHVREAAIEPLGYPEDVTSFVLSWFHDQPDRADQLLAQIEDRQELRRAARIPLLLTFFCLLTEGDKPIPPRRRELYTQLVNRLLAASWVDDRPYEPDREYAQALLRAWAWSAVENAATPTGLGTWPDSFIPLTPARPDQDRAIDHIAPRAEVDLEGITTRRFVHRTLLEHFVAQHLAALDADTAAQQLQPHLWFDPDWEVAAPAAVAAHPNRSRLLATLLPPSTHPSNDPTTLAAAAETDRFLLRVGSESLPDDWDPSARALIEAARIRQSTQELSLIVTTSHWTDSNSQVSAAVLDALPTARHPVAADLVGALVSLAHSDEQRAEALTVVLTALAAAHQSAIVGLVGAVLSLRASEEQRAEALAVVLAALPRAESALVAGLVGAVVSLRASEEQRAEALAAVLARLPTVKPSAVGGLVGAVVSLAHTGKQRAEALAVVLAALTTAHPHAIDDLGRAVVSLAQSEEQRAEALTAVLAALPTAGPWTVGGLVGVVVSLAHSEEQRAVALAVVLAALPNAVPYEVAGVVGAIVSLVHSEEQRVEALAVVLAALPNAHPAAVAGLGGAVASLGASKEQRTVALAAVLAALPAAKVLNPSVVEDLSRVVLSLAHSEEQAAEVLPEVLATLPNAHPAAVAGLGGAVASLGASDEQRAIALAAVLAALPTAYAPAVVALGRTAVSLAHSEEQRAEALAVVLAKLPTVNPSAVGGLVEAVLSLAHSEEQRAEALALVLAALPRAEPHGVDVLSGAVLSLAHTEEQRAEALTAVLAALPTAGPWTVGGLVGMVVSLAHSEEQRAEALPAVLAVLPTADPSLVNDLVAAVRGLSPIRQWLEWM